MFKIVVACCDNTVDITDNLKMRLLNDDDISDVHLNVCHLDMTITMKDGEEINVKALPLGE